MHGALRAGACEFVTSICELEAWLYALVIRTGGPRPRDSALIAEFGPAGATPAQLHSLQQATMKIAHVHSGTITVDHGGAVAVDHGGAVTHTHTHAGQQELMQAQHVHEAEMQLGRQQHEADMLLSMQQHEMRVAGMQRAWACESCAALSARVRRVIHPSSVLASCLLRACLVLASCTWH